MRLRAEHDPRDGDRPQQLVERRLRGVCHPRPRLGAEVLDDHLLHVAVTPREPADRLQGVPDDTWHDVVSGVAKRTGVDMELFRTKDIAGEDTLKKLRDGFQRVLGTRAQILVQLGAVQSKLAATQGEAEPALRGLIATTARLNQLLDAASDDFRVIGLHLGVGDAVSLADPPVAGAVRIAERL